LLSLGAGPARGKDDFRGDSSAGKGCDVQQSRGELERKNEMKEEEGKRNRSNGKQKKGRGGETNSATRGVETPNRGRTNRGHPKQTEDRSFNGGKTGQSRSKRKNGT